jgi:hypothetical protein
VISEFTNAISIRPNAQLKPVIWGHWPNFALCFPQSDLQLQHLCYVLYDGSNSRTSYDLICDLEQPELSLTTLGCVRPRRASLGQLFLLPRCFRAALRFSRLLSRSVDIQLDLRCLRFYLDEMFKVGRIRTRPPTNSYTADHFVLEQMITVGTTLSIVSNM